MEEEEHLSWIVLCWCILQVLGTELEEFSILRWMIPNKEQKMIAKLTGKRKSKSERHRCTKLSSNLTTNKLCSWVTLTDVQLWFRPITLSSRKFNRKWPIWCFWILGSSLSLTRSSKNKSHAQCSFWLMKISSKTRICTFATENS